MILPFETHPALGRSDFVEGPSNRAALAAIDGWRDWPGQKLALIGPPATGKSHLAAIWAGLTDAQTLAPDALEAADPTELAGAPLLIEDANRLLVDAEAGSPGRETALFHLLNAFAATGQPLLLTARTAPARWTVALPDLASRLSAIPLVQIAPPDDALLHDLLVKHFADRGVVPSEPLLAFMLRRMERSARAAAELVAQLDRAALAAKAPLSVPFARRVLGW
ncbi:MAG: chromosomal replication initiator DnaA [Pseudomonadota bacterium]